LHGWRRSLLRFFGAKIGEGSKIAPSCRIWAPWNLVVGDYTALGDGVDCYNVGTITIGYKVAISQRSFLCSATHDPGSLLRPLVVKPIVIQNHAWVAAESLILPGVTIGEGAVIGARSVVTRDMAPWYICVGMPCSERSVRVVKDAHLDPNIMYIAMTAPEEKPAHADPIGKSRE
jgi:putative colanic acid biosynthesis acetyltransferase WcaF